MDDRPYMPDESALSSMSPGELYYLAMADVWDEVSIYDGSEVYLAQLNKVSDGRALLMAAHLCNSEICNGGLHQFFHNSSGVLAPEAVRAFQMLGIPGAARLVSRAMAMLGETYPRDREDDWESPFEALDREFYKCTGTGEFPLQADAFVRANMSLFFR